MAKPKSGKTGKKPTKSLAANRRRRRARRNPGVVAIARPSSNPSGPSSDVITDIILPGFAAYGLSRVLARAVYAIVQKRWPAWGKHAAAVSSVSAFAATWFFAHKVKTIEKYQDGALIGTGIAAAHTIVSTYLPDKYSWLLKDPLPSDVQPTPKQLAAAKAAQAQESVQWQDEYSHLEAQAEGKNVSVPPPAPSKASAAAVASSTVTADGAGLDPSMLEELGTDESLADLYSGAFSLSN